MRTAFALIALIFAGPLYAVVPASELSIGGVASGDTEASVLRHLGSPSRRVDTGEGTELYFPGLVVTVGWLEPQASGRQRRVFALRGTGAHACTPRGLCPGMPVSAATRLYGQTRHTTRETGTFLEYQPTGAACWLQIAAQAGVIRSVSVACQP